MCLDIIISSVVRSPSMDIPWKLYIMLNYDELDLQFFRGESYNIVQILLYI